MPQSAETAAAQQPFPPVDRSKLAAPVRLYETVIADISNRISQGVLKPGDSLPSERELAEQFQLSRVPVREALKILEFLGVICHVPGKGMFVQQMEVPALVSKIFFGLNTSTDNIRQLFEVRLLLETYAARRGAALRTDEELARLRRSLEERPEEAHSQTAESLEFHTAVIEMAHNQIISEFYRLLSSLLAESRTRTDIETRYRDQPLHYHTEIYRAIEAQDSARAEELMRAHLEMEMQHLP